MSAWHDTHLSFDARIIGGSPTPTRPFHFFEEPFSSYTPRSKSLDLLRTAAGSPVAARTSFDTISTLKSGQRISSPIFLNSSIGVQPLTLAEELDEDESDTLGSSSPGHLGVLPRTPSRRQDSCDQLKSKFSMSPVQRSKRSKARISQDKAEDGMMSLDVPRSTFGNWSHSLGVAARKLHKAALTRKGSDESYQATHTLDKCMEMHDRQVVVTPEKAKSTLKSATSLASIRRFITPARRTRKVSTTNGLTVPRSQVVVTVTDAVDSGWVDEDGRETALGHHAGSASHAPHLIVPSGVRSASTGKCHETPRRPKILSAELFEPPPPLPLLQPTSEPANDLVSSEKPLLPTSREPAQSVEMFPKQPAAAPTAGPSKLKTLQLLARRPFNAFNKKVKGMDVSWRPSRSSQDVPERPSLSLEREQQQTRASPRPATPTRRSEDLLSKASPKVIDTATMARSSRSMDLNRLQLPSKVVPLRATGAAATKRRPTLPDAFAKPLPPLTPEASIPIKPTRPAPSIPVAQPRISDLRHPWMRQLQLPAATTRSSKGPNEAWPTSASILPTFSFTSAASRPSAPPDFPTAIPRARKQSPRRPPSSLLGQSLPIPPRSLRSRASTVSSQSSTTSSPSGKIIVSKRSYGQRLRSPSTTGSVRSVGTSILFVDSPPSSPGIGMGMKRIISPYSLTRSPNASRIRSPPKSVAIPKYSPGGRRGKGVHRKPSYSTFEYDSGIDENEEEEEEQEWIDAPVHSQTDLTSLRSTLHSILPTSRPGFVEMNEATSTLSQLVSTFSSSSGSLSLNTSPYKSPPPPSINGRNLCGIMETEEPHPSSSFPLTSPPMQMQMQIGRKTRERLISLASMVSTEANSTFEDSEELQRLLDSIMAADLGNDDVSGGGGGDMALLSPFGSPEEYKKEQQGEKREVKDQGKKSMPPPPKFLLNDRPISPPDSSVVVAEEEGKEEEEQGEDGEEIRCCKILAVPQTGTCTRRFAQR